MKATIKETKLTDGSKVFDVNIFADSRGSEEIGAKVIISCPSQSQADQFMIGLNKLVNHHTIEILEEI